MICSTTQCKSKECSVCTNTQPTDYCLKCNLTDATPLNYFTTCVATCPLCFKVHSLLTTICYPISDTSSYSNSTLIYIDSTYTGAASNGNQDTPYKTLSDAFSNACYTYTELRLKPGTYIISSEQTYNTKNQYITIKSDCDPCTALAILQLSTTSFVFPNGDNILQIYVINVIIDGQKALDPNCDSSNCGFDEYTASSENQNQYNQSLVGGDNDSVALFSLGSDTSLYMTNVTFRNMRQGLKALIYSTGGRIRLSNVNFTNFRVSDSNQADMAAIYIDCESEIVSVGGTDTESCSDTLKYDTGSVSLLGNGYNY